MTEKPAYLVCPTSKPLHTTEDHRTALHGHNPWSAACIKRITGEPYCPHALCPTCNVTTATTDPGVLS